jgi:hypothetical protein
MTRKTSAEIQLNCMMIEELVKSLLMKGISDNEDLVAAVDSAFQPQDNWEMEMYSDAILYAKYATLN